MADQQFIHAIGLSEIQIRNALSRLYYASFHVAVALTGGKGHAEVIKKLADFDGGCSQQLKAMHELRSRMDYDPVFFSEWDMAGLRLFQQEKMQDGISLYYQLLEMWERRKDGRDGR